MNQVMSAAHSVDVELFSLLLHVHADFNQTSNINSFFFFSKENYFWLAFKA